MTGTKIALGAVGALALAAIAGARKASSGSAASTTEQAAPRPARAPLKLYHGAQRWEGPPQIVAHRKGHAEHGPGIYLTTSYETAAKYAKGGGSVYQMELDPELRWMDRGFVPAREAIKFVEGLPRLRGRSDILEGIQRVLGRMRGGDTIPAENLLNNFVNAGAASGKHGPAIAAFFVQHGIDASLTSPPLFGGSGGRHGEDWVVVFNPRVIRSVVKVPAKEVGEGFPFDLPRVRAAPATPAGDVRPAGSQSSWPVRFQGPDQAKQAAMAAREGVLADPNFQAWFEGSEVTDKAGEPLAVYHGTHVNSIEAFQSSGQLSFFATKPDFAALYGTWIYPVYLRCLSLFDYRRGARSMARDFYAETGGVRDDLDARRILMGLSQTNPGIEITDGADERYSASDLTRELFAEALAGGAWDAIEAYDFLSYLQDLGYDGVVLLELGSINYGVFRPEQIKSATGNSGTFDLRSPNISMNKVKGAMRRSP